LNYNHVNGILKVKMITTIIWKKYL